jgi:hypothetical protein
MKSFVRSPFMFAIAFAALALVVLSFNVKAQDCINGVCKMRQVTKSVSYISDDLPPALPVVSSSVSIPDQTLYATPSYTVAPSAPVSVSTTVTRTQYISRPYLFKRCRR